MNKNIQFTLLIPINKQLHEFNFRERTPELYDADTSDLQGSRHYFKMIKAEPGWKILGKALPKWVVESEALISAELIKTRG